MPVSGATPADRVTRLTTHDDVRESMRRLPRVFARPLTMLTGKPQAGQPAIRFTPAAHLRNAVLSLGCGLLISGVALAFAGWALVLLLPGWALTLHGMRNLRMMIYHQCAHRNMWGRRGRDAALGRFVAALLLVQNFEGYSAEHVVDHHAAHHMTMRDPTVQAFLIGLGLRPGMTREQMWRRVAGKLLSPKFHFAFLIGRIRSYFQGARPADRIIVLVTLVIVAGLTTLGQAWLFVAVAWLLPLTIFYQVSNTLRLCVKHTFPPPGPAVRRGKTYFGSLTNAIFLGERAPDPGAGWPAWARWSARMLLVHFPARYLVLTGDTVCHDFHHRNPMSRDWPNYIWAREHDDSAGWPPYRHVWGLVPAIDTVFDSLSIADPVEYDPGRLAKVSDRELYAAFDD